MFLSPIWQQGFHEAVWQCKSGMMARVFVRFAPMTTFDAKNNNLGAKIIPKEITNKSECYRPDDK